MASIRSNSSLFLIESISKFLDFDEIIDSMILRKNKSQYVMVIQCKGINYDLLGEEEKLAVEHGFTQFLNTLRDPVQLYIQTRSLNLKDSVEQYSAKVNEVKGKVTTDEEGKLGIDGQFNLQLNYIASSLNSHSTTKFFTFGDKYLLIQTGFQRFVLMIVRDTRGRIVNKPADFKRLYNEFEKKRNTEIDKQHGSVNGKIQPTQNNLGKQ